MAQAFYNITLLVSAFVVFAATMAIGIPSLILILKFIDKHSGKVSIPKKKRVRLAILFSLLTGVLLGAYVRTAEYREDIALRIALEDSSLSLPLKVIVSVDHPSSWNRGDDFGVAKKWRILFAPSNDDIIMELDRLCQTDISWSFSDGHYLYSEDIFEEELRIHVDIDLTNRIICTEYHKF